jgi:hypothetical protein
MLADVLFIPPNGLFVLFLTGFPLGRFLSTCLATLGDKVNLEGRERCACAIDLEDCHVTPCGTRLLDHGEI